MGKKLFDEELKKELGIPELYETDGKPKDQVIVKLKYFDIFSNWTWYIIEASLAKNEEDTEDKESWLAFGYVVGFEAELGYISLDELEGINKNFPRIERDMHFKPVSLEELMRKHSQRGN